MSAGHRNTACQCYLIQDLDKIFTKLGKIFSELANSKNAKDFHSSTPRNIMKYFKIGLIVGFKCKWFSIDGIDDEWSEVSYSMLDYIRDTSFTIVIVSPFLRQYFLWFAGNMNNASNVIL